MMWNHTRSSDDPVLVGSGDTSFILLSAALVFLMTPGVSFFYGGLVEHHTVLNTMMMSFACAALVTIQWVLVGYSFAFGPDNPVFGNFQFAGMNDITNAAYAPYGATVPHTAVVFFQLTFAIVTPALISGAVIGRMNFKSWLAFVVCWTTIVYDFVAHSMWSIYPDPSSTAGHVVSSAPDGPGPSGGGGGASVVVAYGWLKEFGAIDFAGGTVVHMTSGFSALIASIIVGKRKVQRDMPPHNVPLVLLGAAMLWFGWFGFNGGSAGNSHDGIAALATLNTQVAASSAFVMWMILDSFILDNFSAIGAAFGAVVGLVGVTPAAGFVSPMSAMAIGALSSLAAYFACRLKTKLGFDDSLDAFACHGVGGLVGTVLTGCFASKQYNPMGDDGLLYGNPRLLGAQLLACLVVGTVSCVGTALILGALQLIPALKPRVADGLESALDFTTHGVSAYPIRAAPNARNSREVSRSVQPSHSPQAAPAPQATSGGVVATSGGAAASGNDSPAHRLSGADPNPTHSSSGGGSGGGGSGDDSSLRRRQPASGNPNNQSDDNAADAAATADRTRFELADRSAPITAAAAAPAPAAIVYPSFSYGDLQLEQNAAAIESLVAASAAAPQTPVAASTTATTGSGAAHPDSVYLSIRGGGGGSGGSGAASQPLTLRSSETQRSFEREHLNRTHPVSVSALAMNPITPSPLSNPAAAPAAAPASASAVVNNLSAVRLLGPPVFPSGHHPQSASVGAVAGLPALPPPQPLPAGSGHIVIDWRRPN